MEIVPGVHAIDFGFVWSYLYEESDRLTAIDAGVGGASDRIFEAIKRIDRAPEDLRQVILTHCHADHAGGAAELAERTGARVLAHALDTPVIAGERAAPEPNITDLERPFYEQAVRNTPPAPPALVQVELNDEDEIDLDGGAQVVHVPGHTPGSIAIYVPSRRLLFSGDAAAELDGDVIVGVFNVDRAQAVASFRKLAELDFEVACFGHGRPLDREASLAFRRAAERLG